MERIDKQTRKGTLEEFVKALPKTETHLHIEGALPYELLREMDSERFPREPDFRRKGYKYKNFVDFENILLAHAAVWFTSPERYHEACKRIFAGLQACNVKYVETSLHLAMTEFIGADGKELIHAIKSAAPKGMEVRVIGGFLRNGYTDAMKPVIDNMHTWDELDGIDLHGQEWLELEDWTAPVWKRCKDAGKIIKVHAGEFGGPDKIVEAIDLLGVERIQHGVRSVEKTDLVKRIADLGIVLDVCPLSNEGLQVVPSLEEHPLKDLCDAGVICTINTDDPLCFANTIEDEYFAVGDRLGFSFEDIGQLAKNGFAYSTMEKSLINKYTSEIDSLVDAYKL
ncbi:adenosine deaminase [Puniceicoccaceae bacterium K14]|nr:adenosine deaminase [Puniceicoccaceae bacterium K14]